MCVCVCVRACARTSHCLDEYHTPVTRARVCACTPLTVLMNIIHQLRARVCVRVHTSHCLDDYHTPVMCMCVCVCARTSHCLDYHTPVMCVCVCARTSHCLDDYHTPVMRTCVCVCVCARACAPLSLVDYHTPVMCVCVCTCTPLTVLSYTSYIVYVCVHVHTSHCLDDYHTPVTCMCVCMRVRACTPLTVLMIIIHQLQHGTRKNIWQLHNQSEQNTIEYKQLKGYVAILL